MPRREHIPLLIAGQSDNVAADRLQQLGERVARGLRKWASIEAGIACVRPAARCKAGGPAVLRMTWPREQNWLFERGSCTS